MKSLFETDTYEEIRARLNGLTENNERQWGKMTVGQMLRPCQLPIEIPLGKSDMKPPNFLIKMFGALIKKSLYNDKPWKQNLRTAPGFAITDDKDFGAEKERLLQLADELYGKRDTQLPKHPVFGELTMEQWGKMHYKHLDHHLRQFNA